MTFVQHAFPRRSVLGTAFIFPLLITFFLLTGCDTGTTPTADGLASGDALLAKASASPTACDARVNNTLKKLLPCVTIEGVRAHQAAFQSIADANGGFRASGTPGYDASVQYVAAELEAAGYAVTLQSFPFDAFIPLGPSTLAQLSPASVSYVEGVDFNLMSQTDPGSVTGPVVAVDLDLGLGNNSTSGCEPSDFTGFPVGSIALIQRGGCTFQLKAENASAAGAVGAIIFNQGRSSNQLGLINGTVGFGYAGDIPVFEAPYTRGVEWASTSGLVLSMFANVLRGTVDTYNVLADLPGKTPDNVVMLGGHLDSVAEGPGIQDNGSGSAALLETALQMAKVKPRNTVRFAWWGAEEPGLIGSGYYVNTLPPNELDAIALYLNFDMIASPNFVYFIYDGDDSDGVGAGPGPDGSAEIEALFESYYDRLGLPYQGTDFSGRSDYFAFINMGIPAGGLFTGAEGLKTPAEAALWGGTAGDAYDPCYHLACDTFDNVSLEALEVNADAVAYAALSYGMNTELVNGVKGKGNFKPLPETAHAIR